tara:strand:+ start:6909 stop:8084 length:1176 start_codon:yes stop_codon:yes gene_type:complete
LSWVSLPLDQLADPKPRAFTGGPFGSKLTSKDYVAEGVPVIRGANLTGGRHLREDNFVFVSEQKLREDLFGNVAHRGDIVFTQRGTLGQVSIIPSNSLFEEYVISQSQMKLTVDPSKADSRFVYYWFSARETIEKIISQNSSSGVPHINLTVLRNFKISVPTLREQQHIADILSAYDDLIENNRRRIALLEEAARLLYREWFVHFRFPGHEHVKITDGLPEGWKRLPFGAALTLQRGFDLPVAKRLSGDIPVYGSSGIVGMHNLPKVSIPTVITGRSGSLGEVRYVDDPCWPLNTSLWVKEFKLVSAHFAYFLMKNMDLKQFNGGASVPTLDRKVVHAASINLPSKLLISLFDEQVIMLFAQKKILENQIRKLNDARDILLPRLMNGEIAV